MVVVEGVTDTTPESLFESVPTPLSIVADVAPLVQEYDKEELFPEVTEVGFATSVGTGTCTVLVCTFVVHEVVRIALSVEFGK